tara:strand:- start:2832 stop:3026 length:195 start_codon:yes stop_codon:yes gene_type:complete
MAYIKIRTYVCARSHGPDNHQPAYCPNLSHPAAACGINNNANQHRPYTLQPVGWAVYEQIGNLQ